MIDEPNISVNILNGVDLPPSAIVDARKLCQEKTKEKGLNDVNLNSIAKDQTKIVLEEFYSQYMMNHML